MTIAIINGPNLNLLGTREPNIYGNTTFESYLEKLKTQYSKINIEYFQSNIEGEIISYIQSKMNSCDAIIINPAGYSHTSVAIRDALAMINKPKVEVHISNIYKREEFRHISLTASQCDGVISGLGLKGYELAIHYCLQIINQ